MTLGPINVAAVKKHHAALMRDLKVALDKQSEHAAEEAKLHVWQAGNFKHRTRNLARSTETRIVRSKNGRIIRVKNKATYATIVEKGSKPHTIQARRKKFLRFVVNGQVVFRRKVRHPGTRPTWFLKKATKHAFMQFDDGFKSAVKRMTAKFNRAKA